MPSLATSNTGSVAAIASEGVRSPVCMMGRSLTANDAGRKRFVSCDCRISLSDSRLLVMPTPRRAGCERTAAEHPRQALCHSWFFLIDNERYAMSDAELDELRAIVTAVAERELLPRFTAMARAQKQDGSVLTEADLAAQTALKHALAQRWPQYAFLGEEMDESAQRQLLQDTAAGVWCVDPLDGTSNFAAGIPFFAVSVALLRGGAVELGVVYGPVRQECFYPRRAPRPRSNRRWRSLTSNGSPPRSRGASRWSRRTVRSAASARSRSTGVGSVSYTQLT